MAGVRNSLRITGPGRRDGGREEVSGKAGVRAAEVGLARAGRQFPESYASLLFRV